MARKKQPDPKLVELARLYHEMEVLRKSQAATQARMIRACVTTMSLDTGHYRIRGHESYIERAKIVEENKRNKAAAPLYLLALATQLENYAGVYNTKPSDNLMVSSTKGE